jgi:ferredoxin-type protein NapH
MRAAVDPGRGWSGSAWVWARRLTQSLALVTIVLAPLLGGWQRLDRSEMAVFAAGGWDLPDTVRGRLPLGDRPTKAYDALVLHGGGSAVEYLSVPVVDPVAGSAALLRTGLSWKLAIAFGLPLLLAALLGRVFCGWLCPFGVIARATRSVLARLPWHPPVWRLPDRRPLRWLILGGAVAISVVGVQAAVFFFLPHLAVQQTVYAYWLLGGGGAIAGVLLGLIAAGLVFGPTAYCATLCPTGAALNLAARGKRVGVTLDDPKACGKHCHLCDSACWLGLHPASGDPGPDCDSCARCFPVCPRDNLRVAVGKPRRRHLPVVAAGLLLALAAPAAAQPRAPTKPDYLLNGERELDGVTVAVSMVDQTGVKLDLDWSEAEQGIELSLFVARGTRGDADERGLLPAREVYTGPLEVELRPAGGDPVALSWDAPNSPVSTQGTEIYRRRIEVDIEPGDEVVVRAIPGWLARDVRWTVPAAGTAPGAGATLLVAAAAALIFMGLLSLALAVPDRAGAAQPLRGPDGNGS